MLEKENREMVVFQNAHCYLPVRIANSSRAHEVENGLQKEGLIVNNPCNIDLVDTPPEDMPRQVSDTCYEMMNNSASTVVVYLENRREGKRIGRDCATEIGYTVGSGKPVFVLVDEGTIKTARKRLIQDLPIHHNDIIQSNIVDTVGDLIKLLRPTEPKE